MAHCRAEPGIKSRFERGDARIDPQPEWRVEVLADIDEYALLAQRGRSEKRDIVAAGLQAARQGHQGLARHNDDLLAVHGAFGRTGAIERNRHRQIALLGASVAIKPLAGLPAGETFGGGASMRSIWIAPFCSDQRRIRAQASRIARSAENPCQNSSGFFS